MIIERALKSIFCNIEVCGREAQFSYGTQRELNQWIAKRNLQQEVKFPLIWFVSNDYTENKGVYKVDNARIIVFMNTKVEWLNETRDKETYQRYIEPLVKQVISKLKNTLHLDVIGINDYEKFRYRNIRNYGVSLDSSISQQSNSFSSSQPKSSKSITTDYVDATFIDFAFEIKPQCII